MPLDASASSRLSRLDHQAGASAVRAEANIAKARQIAAGHFKDGQITSPTARHGATNNAQAELVKRDLIRLGFDPANITMRLIGRRLL